MNHNLKVALIAALLLILPLSGFSQNGITVNEFPFFETNYVECLGEDVDFDVWITERILFVTTPSGEHIVDNWFIEGEAIGVDSERVWYTAHAVSPGTFNSNGNQYSGGWSLSAMYNPVEGDGPKFSKSARVRMVIDANGNPHVEHNDVYQFRCFRNKN